MDHSARGQTGTLMLQTLNEQHSARFKNSASSLQEFRQKMMKEAIRLGLPNRRLESWHYTPVSGLTTFVPKSTFANTKLSKSEVETHRLGDVYLLTFVDGQFHSELSDTKFESGLRITDLTQVKPAELEGLQSWIESTPQPKRETANLFRALNAAYLEQGLFVEIAPKSKVSKPVQVLNIQTNSQALATFLQVFVSAGKLSESVIVTSSVGNSEGVSSIFSYGQLADEAHLHIVRSSIDQNTSVDESNFSLGRNAKLKSLNLVMNPLLNRHALNVFLNQPGSETHLSGLSVLDNKQVSDNQINVEHLVPNCRSRQNFKGVLSGQSKAIFSGGIYIGEGAIGSDSSQMNKNLILSRQAEADIKPQLEVYADDVKATHGAAIGRLDDEELFYLQSRGIGREEALQMLANAFVDDVLSGLPPGVHENLRQKFLAVFSKIEKQELYGS